MAAVSVLSDAFEDGLYAAKSAAQQVAAVMTSLHIDCIILILYGFFFIPLFSFINSVTRNGCKGMYSQAPLKLWWAIPKAPALSYPQVQDDMLHL